MYLSIYLSSCLHKYFTPQTRLLQECNPKLINTKIAEPTRFQQLCNRHSNPFRAYSCSTTSIPAEPTRVQQLQSLESLLVFNNFNPCRAYSCSTTSIPAEPTRVQQPQSLQSLLVFNKTEIHAEPTRLQQLQFLKSLLVFNNFNLCRAYLCSIKL